MLHSIVSTAISEHQKLLACWGSLRFRVFLTMLPILVEIEYHQSSNSQQPRKNAFSRSQNHE